MENMNPCFVLYAGQSILIPNNIPISGYFEIDESGNQKISQHTEVFLINDTQVEDLGDNQNLVTNLSNSNGASKESNFQVGEALIHCSNCNNNFEDINQYKEHEKTHHSKKLFECDSCHEKFNKMCLYRKHLSTHKESKLFDCVICGTGFNIENNYKVHMALHGNSLVCPICDLPFQRKASLKSHLATHQVEEIHTCRECASEFNNLVDLSIHIKTHTIDSDQKLICRFCKVRFDTLKNLKSHVADHLKVKKVLLNVTKPKKEVAIKKLKHKCNVCEKAFSKYCLLTRHMRIHNGERPFLCSICFKSFTQKVSLDIHLMKHTGIKPFCCTLCPAKFYQKCNLKVHVEKTHTATAEGEKNFKCAECDCIFKKLASLNTHVKKNHSDQDFVNVTSVIDQLKNLENQLDGKSVKQEKNGKTKHSVESINKQHKENAGDLSENYQIHTLMQKVDGANKVYVCSYCPKEAKKPSDLIRHIRTHTKEKPFKCQCGDSFALETTLRSHMRNHLEKKCEICSKVFISTKQFRAHLRKHEVTGAVPVELKQSNGPEIAKNTVSKGRSRLSTKISMATCSLCSVTFSSPEILKTHMESHAQTNGSNDSLLKYKNWTLIECLYCKEKFENLLSFQKHIETHCPQNIQGSKQNESDTVGPEESSSFLNQILHTPSNTIQFNNDPLVIHNDNTNLLKKSFPLVETEGNEDIQTFLVDYPEVQNGDYLTNYFVSQSDDKIILNTVGGNNEQSPLIFKIENINNENDNLINNDSILISNAKSSDAGLCRTVDVSQIMPSRGSGSPVEPVDNGSEHDVSNRYLSDSLYLYPPTETNMDTGEESGPETDNIRADPNQNLTNETQENDSLSAIHCLVCKKMFENVAPYLAHMKSCTASSPESSREKSQEKVKQKCDKEEPSSTKSNINPKIKKNLICVHCKKEFSNRGTYMFHIKCHHKKGNGLHKCDYCDREFKKPSDLGRHLRTHTGERPFQCDKCDKKFSLKSTLEGHYRTHNPTTIKSFVCEVCNSFFSSKASRKLHMHVHTGLQPHKCSFCDKHFRTAAHKKSHEKKIHLSNKERRERGNSKRITNILATAVDMAVGEIQNEKKQKTPDYPEIQADIADPKFATESVTIDPALLLIRSSNIFLQGMDQELMPSSVTEDDLVPSKASDMISSDDCVKDNIFTKPLIMDNYFSIINQDSNATKESTQFVMNKCSQCTKFFVSNEDLLQHEKSHSLGAPYSCCICDVMVDGAEELGNHLQSVHAIPWEG